MKTNRLLAILIAFFTCLSAHAVLQEEDMQLTIAVLKAELLQKHKEQKRLIAKYEEMAEEQHEKTVELMQKSSQTALMLYSQQTNYTFDIAYACHAATDQYNTFMGNQAPYDKIVTYIESEIERYESLIASLKALPPRIGTGGADTLPGAKITNEDSVRFGEFQRDSLSMLSPVARADRDSCIGYATKLLDNLYGVRQKIAVDRENNETVVRRLKKSNDYAAKKYVELQNNIFLNGNENYFKLLRDFRKQSKFVYTEFQDKYFNESKANLQSGWGGEIIFGLILTVILYMAMSVALGFLLVTKIMPYVHKRTKRFNIKDFDEKKPWLVMAVGVIIFAVTVMFVSSSMSYSFIVMATRLLIEFAWLLGITLVSLLVRLNGQQTKNGFKAYMPMILMGFIIIIFRIMFIPNNTINLIYPPILLVFTFWQYRETRTSIKGLPKTEKIYSYISLGVMLVCCVSSLVGYTLLAVQMLIWWLFQLTFVHTITSMFVVLKNYGNNVLTRRIRKDNVTKLRESFKQLLADGKVLKDEVPALSKEIDLNNKNSQWRYIRSTWFYDLCNQCIVPMLGTFSVLFSIFWSANIFNLTEICKQVFFTNFVDVEGVVQLSIFKLTVVVALAFLFRFINYLFKAFYRDRCERRQDHGNTAANIGLVNSLSSIVVWGGYFILVLIILQVPKSGISIVTAGLATGVGFAMKDLLENFFYGLTLMAGRIKIGDWVECDGVRGRVESISYQSTQIHASDGSVIAFLNSALLNKNFKNLTRTNTYELAKVNFGVAYGTNIKQVREILTKAILALNHKNVNGDDVIDTNKGVTIVVSEMADSSVDMLVTMWVPVINRFKITSAVKETIYETLNANNIEIPFPQRDVHIKS